MKKFLISILAFSGFSVLGQEVEPDVPHGTPGELNDKGQWTKELTEPKKWKNKYHYYEMAVLMWRYYQKVSYVAQSKDLFSAMEMFLTEETDMHEKYYEELNAAGSIVKNYNKLREIRNKFKAIIHYSRKTNEVLSKQEFDGEVAIKIKGKLDFLKEEAVQKLLVLPSIAGEDLNDIKEDIDKEIKEKSIQASTLDRIKIIDVIHEDMSQMAALSRDIYFRVNQIANNRNLEINWNNNVKLLIKD